ncbi:hypothetical protein A7K93_04065 [Candidatus Methylacidiphilum fumarolicum]|nr:hypothetical protein A7K73_02330 [Candidatus Methylacidiphilum fumarolicum]TFE74200.1 hypothetical protein A7K93_04065 [Candidatus Methylacidiphilum fumarolicum]TFE75699.1 hypothetical protein A7K72_00745 [Candidatus Methylacidiphilum fumarolicum]TFE75859.1 hypothetical protein A7D33_00960 [Candidatus Methylacidiphilum fumarolicum]
MKAGIAGLEEAANDSRVENLPLNRKKRELLEDLLHSLCSRERAFSCLILWLRPLCGNPLVNVGSATCSWGKATPAQANVSKNVEGCPKDG